LLATGLVAAGPARAQLITLKPLVDARTRYETVDQDEIAKDADALTVRVRAGVEATSGHFSTIVEVQGNFAAVDRYFDGLHPNPTRPLVADPEDIALYRAQVRYATKGLAITGGRQKITLDDERFVGPVNFRNNGQSFDGMRAEFTAIPHLKADISYVWSVRTIWGVDGLRARQQAISGENVLANISYATSIGLLTGFAYLIDQDEAAVQGFRFSSQTYGGRLAGGHAFSRAVKLSYQASFARQSNYHRNPNSYQADYYMVDAGLDLARLRLGGGYEVLGADRGTALTSFQTPLGTLFKFQGWADKFLTTPPDGVRDLYGSAGYALKTGTLLGTITLQAVYHRFDSDRLVRRYGDEIDLLASMKIKRTMLSVRFADYYAKSFATNTRKLWLQADWAM
jgi:hypothetical protein